MSGLNVFLATAIRLTILLVASFRCVPDFVQGLTPGATLCFTQLALPEGGGLANKFRTSSAHVKIKVSE